MATKSSSAGALSRAGLVGIVTCFLFGCSQPMQRMSAAPTDLTELSATDAASMIRAGSVRSEDLVRALIAKAKARSNLNAFITLDEQGALKAAQAADAAVKAGTAKGALHGVPLAIKDNIHVARLPNTAGAPPLKNFIPTANAPVAQKLIDAGAIVLGKTNMHELAFGITTNNGGFGAAGNAYDPTRFPGGSSGGTGSAHGAGRIGQRYRRFGAHSRWPKRFGRFASDAAALRTGRCHAHLAHARHRRADGAHGRGFGTA